MISAAPVRIASAITALACTTLMPAATSAQVVTRQPPPRAMPAPIRLPTVPTIRRIPAPPLSPAQRSQIVKQLTGSPTATPTSGTQRLSFYPKPGVGRVTAVKLESARSGDGTLSLSAELGSAVGLFLSDNETEKLEGLRLFECAVTGSKLQWFGFLRGVGFNGHGAAATATAGGKVVFVVDMSLLEFPSVLLLNPHGGAWTFQYCDVTTISK